MPTRSRPTRGSRAFRSSTWASTRVRRTRRSVPTGGSACRPRPALTGVLETRDALYLTTLFGHSLGRLDKADLAPR